MPDLERKELAVALGLTTDLDDMEVRGFLLVYSSKTLDIELRGLSVHQGFNLSLEYMKTTFKCFDCQISRLSLPAKYLNKYLRTQLLMSNIQAQLASEIFEQIFERKTLNVLIFKYSCSACQ